MMQQVKSFVEGFSNSALRMPYVYAVLGCGHSAHVDVKPSRYACAQCGVEGDIKQRCACGYNGGYRLSAMADPHSPEWRITQIGDSVECARCDSYQKQLEWLRALEPADVQHARYREWCGEGAYYFYRRDASSPSGVMLMGTVAATAEVDAILAAKRVAPLSPTENLCAPSQGRW